MGAVLSGDGQVIHLLIQASGRTVDLQPADLLPFHLVYNTVNSL